VIAKEETQATFCPDRPGAPYAVNILPRSFRRPRSRASGVRRGFWSTPARIFLCQAPGQDANFLPDSRSATAPPGPPLPIEAETDTMPADDGVWVYKSELSQQDPEQQIRRTQARFGTASA
jgi:hypothetical protein